MSVTDDPKDPDLQRLDDKGMQTKYLVLSEEERAKGFVRPVRDTYVHEYIYDKSPVPTVQTTRKGMGGCGALTIMAKELAETYARDPSFYGATWCSGCSHHFPLYQFHWDLDNITTDYQIVGS